MEKATVERVLVQGEVIFKVSVNQLRALVSPEIADDEESMLEWFEEKAFEMLNAGVCDDAEASFENDVPVILTAESAEKYTDKVVSRAEWKEIIEESKKLKG